jgi:hypothetical protein
MRTLFAILLLVLGVVWPLGALLWLAMRLNRPPPPAPRQMGFILALTLLLPISLVLTGFGLLSPAVQGSQIYWGAVLASWLGVTAAGVGLIRATRATRSDRVAPPPEAPGS